MEKSYKPYSCGICTKAFWSKRYLNEHVKLHKDGNIGEEVIIPCSWPGCSKTYKSQTVMLNHYKDKHKMSSLPARVEATSTTTSQLKAVCYYHKCSFIAIDKIVHGNIECCP